MGNDAGPTATDDFLSGNFERLVFDRFDAQAKRGHTILQLSMFFEPSDSTPAKRLLYFDRTTRATPGFPPSTVPRITPGRSILRSFTPRLTDRTYNLSQQVREWVQQECRQQGESGGVPDRVGPFGVVYNQTDTNGVPGPTYLLLVFAVRLSVDSPLRDHDNGRCMLRDDGGRWASDTELLTWASSLPRGDRLVLHKLLPPFPKPKEKDGRFFIPWQAAGSGGRQ
jgi:hypothetical protein